MEQLDVPEVTQLPELSGGEENAVGFADMVLTSLLVHDAAVLYAEHTTADGSGSVSWRIEPRGQGVATHDIEIGVSPTQGSYRSVLARFGHHYLGGQLYNGYTMRLLRQRNRVHRCHIYLSNFGQTGFWIRVYAVRTT